MGQVHTVLPVPGGPWIKLIGLLSTDLTASICGITSQHPQSNNRYCIRTNFCSKHVRLHLLGNLN